MGAPREVQVRFAHRDAAEEQREHAQLAVRVLESARAYLKREQIVGHIRDEIRRAPATTGKLDVASYVLREVDQALHALQFAHGETTPSRYVAGPDETSTKHKIAWSVTDTRDGSMAGIFLERCPVAGGFEIGSLDYAEALRRVRVAATAYCERLNAGETETGWRDARNG